MFHYIVHGYFSVFRSGTDLLLIFLPGGENIVFFRSHEVVVVVFWLVLRRPNPRGRCLSLNQLVLEVSKWVAIILPKHE